MERELSGSSCPHLSPSLLGGILSSLPFGVFKDLGPACFDLVGLPLAVQLRGSDPFLFDHTFRLRCVLGLGDRRRLGLALRGVTRGSGSGVWGWASREALSCATWAWKVASSASIRDAIFAASARSASLLSSSAS